MKSKLKEKLFSRNLDDQAKVFALASGKKYSSVFRLSVTLKEKIDGEILQKAVELAIKKFKAFKVQMERGVFWYYFIENKMKPIVTTEVNIPFKKVNTKENNKYLFRVTYLENKINIEFFHALTDGHGGSQFFKEIIYRYLELKHPECLELYKVNENEIIYDSENAYTKIYQKNVKKKFKTKIAYRIKGKKLDNGNVGISHYNINLPEIKKCTKIQECSISIYIAAMIAYAIYEGDYKIHNGRRPINLCLPISLQKYFATETISNFFSYMMITLKLKKNKDYTFEDFLNMIKKEFEKKFKLERIIETISNDVGITNNTFVGVVPLELKKLAAKIASIEVKRHFTMTISNIGKFDVKEKYSKYIDNVFIMLSPDWAERIKCGICSYENNLVVSFGSLLKNREIENKFKQLLIEKNIKFQIENSFTYLSC